MKPIDIKKKARDKANSMEPRTKQLEFVDKAGVPGSCSVKLPAERFSYAITRTIAENLLTKHGENLPFDIWRPVFLHEDEDWLEVVPAHLINGKLPLEWSKCEIWLPAPTDDLPLGIFQSPKAH